MRAIGGHCVFSNEWNPFAAETYNAWTGHEINTDDLRSIDYRRTIPDHDVLCAGFPCQPFSIAGVSKKNALGRLHGFRDAEQGNLFFAICDLAKVKRPPVMILENVKNLRSHDKGNTWRIINESLDTLGYHVRSEIIDAQAWVPQHRERVFLVCFDRRVFDSEQIQEFRFPRRPRKQPQLSEILEAGAPDRKYMLSDHLWRYLREYAAKHQAMGNGFGYGLASRDGVTRTLSARYYKDGSEILVRETGWRNPRRLTPSEAARLMGFSRKYARLMGFSNEFPQVVSDTQAYKQFGNAVCPPVVEALGKEVVRVLHNSRRP